jgi:hypothetical protein
MVPGMNWVEDLIVLIITIVVSFEKLTGRAIPGSCHQTFASFS